MIAIGRKAPREHLPPQLQEREYPERKSQAKTNENSYVQEWVDSFKRAITDVFEIGQKYIFIFV